MIEVEGRKGGKGGGSSARTPVEDPNTLRATNIAQIVDLIGEGPMAGLVDGMRSVYFDETPVQNDDGSYNFEGVRMVARPGYPDQDPIPGLPGVENESDVSVEVRRDTPVVRGITNAEADAVRIRVQVPRLTYQDKENGNMKGSEVEFAFDIRTEGATSWTELGRYKIEGKTTSPYQRSYRLNLPGRGPSWEIRMRRITADDQGVHIANDLYWASYTTIIDAKLSYPDSALIGIEADARQFGTAIPQRAYHVLGRIVKVPSNYDPSTRAYSSMWDGTFKTAWTDNPAWVYYDVLRNSRYGAGQNYVDKWALYEIAKYCDELVPDGYGGQEPRFTCNLVLNTRKEAFEVLDSLSSIFRGMTYWASSQIMPVADMPKDPVKLFTRANVVGDFEYSGTAMKARHSAILVSWNDPEDFYRQTIEVVEDGDMVQKLGWNQKDVTAIGCSSRGQAHRLGKWMLYTEKFETETISFTAGSDAFDLRPGDIISVSDPMVTGARLGGRVARTGKRELLLDAYPEDASGSWDIDVVMPSGGIETRGVESIEGDRVVLSEQLSQEPVDGAMWVLRSHQAEPLSFRVLSVSEGDTPLTFEVTALKHEPGKYALVEDGTPLPERSDSLIPKGPVSPPYEITVETYTSLSAGAEQQNLSVSWTASDDPRTQQYQAEVKSPSDTAWQQKYLGTGLSFDIADIEAGEWQVRVRGITGMGRPSGWAYRTTNVGGLLVPLPPTAVTVDAKTFTLSLRPKGALPGMQWEFWRSNVALDTDKIESNAVLVATTSDLVDSELQPGTTYYYYIRGVNAYGVSDWYPVQATTEMDAGKILEVVEGQITESHLFQNLNERIDKIDDPASVEGSVAYRVAQEAESRIADVEAEAAARAAAIQEEQGARAAAIQNEADARTTADESLSSDISSLTAAVDKNAADITTEQRARADGDSALATDITNLSAQVDQDISAAIANEQTARSDADDALASDITSIRATFGKAFRQPGEPDPATQGPFNDGDFWVDTDDGNRLYQFDAASGAWVDAQDQEIPALSASISNEQQARADGDSALASDITTLDTRVGDNAAAITAEQQARADGDSALASDITTLQSTVDSNTAAIQTEATTRADEDAALASQITTVQTDLDGKISSVQQYLTSDIDAIENTLNAEYTLKLDVDGYVGGMGIANDGEMIDFAIRADRFYVADPDTSTAQLPFVIDNGNVIIEEGHLGAISVGKLQDDLGNPITTVDGTIRADMVDADNLHVAEAATFTGTAQSDNYSAGVRGWIIYPNGAVEFNEGVFNGQVEFKNVTGAGALASKDSLGYWEVTGTKPPTDADKTGSNTAYDTARVAGSSASNVRQWALNGNSAKSRVDGWVRPNSTLIDGNKIYTGDAYVDTLQIKGQAVTVTAASSVAGKKYFYTSNLNNTQYITHVSLNAQSGKILLDVHTFVYAEGGSPVHIRILENGSTIYKVELINFREAGAGNIRRPFSVKLARSPGSGTHTYRLEMSAADYGNGPTWAEHSTVACLGTKR